MLSYENVIRKSEVNKDLSEHWRYAKGMNSYTDKWPIIRFCMKIVTLLLKEDARICMKLYQDISECEVMKYEERFIF